jgi:hypothetical protein
MSERFFLHRHFQGQVNILIVNNKKNLVDDHLTSTFAAVIAAWLIDGFMDPSAPSRCVLA